MSEVSSAIQSTAKEAVSHAKAHIEGLDPASGVLASVSDVPCVQDAIHAMKTHGERLVHAVDALGEAIHYDNLAASAEAGSGAGRQHINMDKLAAATASLKEASDLSPVAAAVKGMADDEGLIGQMREGFEANGLTGGYDDVRGALKHVNTDHIGIVNRIDGMVHDAADAGADAEALAHLKAELEAVDAKLKSTLGDVLAQIDTMLARLAS